MSGSMSGMGTTTASTAHCTSGNNGAARSGLDVTNSPNMQMAGPGTTMNMNGADASAAAGLNSTKQNWSSAGPAFPASEANELLADGANGPSDIHMAATGCAAEPTFSEEIRAAQYVQATSEAVARFTSPPVAVAAGYVLVSPVDYPVTYYVNPQIVAANNADSHTLNPESVERARVRADPFGSASPRRRLLSAAHFAQ